MKKIFSFLFVALFSVSLFATDYYYRGDDNSWGATKMTLSDDGNYWYIQSSNSAHKFKIATSTTSYDYNYTFVNNSGFNSTNVTNIGDYGQDNCYCWQSGTYYILVYKPGTSVNTSETYPVICAATYLPDDRACTVYFVNKNDWTGKIRAYGWLKEMA